MVLALYDVVGGFRVTTICIVGGLRVTTMPGVLGIILVHPKDKDTILKKSGVIYKYSLC